MCWAAAGDNSPYLSADGQRYRYRKGDNVTDCPSRRDYADKEVMLLRFEPLPAQNHMFSLLEGYGGENQLIDPASTKGRF